MNWFKRIFCAASAAVMLLTAQLTAFASNLTFTKEEAWEAIQNTDPKVATRKYDIDCVDINDLTEADLNLFFEMFWKNNVETGQFEETGKSKTTSDFLDDYFRCINGTFYGKTPTSEKLQEIYQTAETTGFDTTEAKASHPDFPAQTTMVTDSVKPVNPAEQPTNQTAEVTPKTTATETENNQDDTSDESKDDGGLNGFSWFLILLGIAALGGGAFAIYKKKS